MVNLKVSIRFILLCSFSLQACVKDKPNPDKRPDAVTSNKGIVILNEGAYGINNADISFLDLDKRVINNDLVQSQNNKRLGDVAQSIHLINGDYFVTVNNSSKIVVLDTSNFQVKATIPNINYPRYILQVSPTKAYVTSLYYPHIYVIDLPTLQHTNTITVNHINTEQMLLVNGAVYCTSWDTTSNVIYKINPNTDQVVQNIPITGRASHSITLDKHNKLWVMSGNKYKNKTSYLSCIDPTTDTEIKTFAFPSQADPFRLICNTTRDTLYFIQVNYNGGSLYNGVYRMAIDATALPENAFIPALLNSYFWAMAIDSNTQHIYLSDPKGFAQQSTISEFNPQGQLIQQFQAGIGANTFLFR